MQAPTSVSTSVRLGHRSWRRRTTWWVAAALALAAFALTPPALAVEPAAPEVDLVAQPDEPSVDVPEAEGLLLPFPSERVSVAPANPAVNRAGVEGPELLTPPDEPVAPPSDTLF